jgi:hypothetical protein
MLNQEHDMMDIINVDDDGLNPPIDNCPDEVEGATGYCWNSELQQWQPIFGNEQQG